MVEEIEHQKVANGGAEGLEEVKRKGCPAIGKFVEPADAWVEALGAQYPFGWIRAYRRGRRGLRPSRSRQSQPHKHSEGRNEEYGKEPGQPAQ